MSTNRPDWFGTGESSAESEFGRETDRTWFENLSFDRTSPGTVDPDRSTESWALVGDASERPRQVGRTGEGSTTNTSVDDSTASVDSAASKTPVDSAATETESTAEVGTTDGDRTVENTRESGNGGFLAWLKSLFGL